MPYGTKCYNKLNIWPIHFKFSLFQALGQWRWSKKRVGSKWDQLRAGSGIPSFSTRLCSSPAGFFNRPHRQRAWNRLFQIWIQKGSLKDLQNGSIKSYPLLNQTWLTTPQAFALTTFMVKWIHVSDKRHTCIQNQSCKLKCCLGVYPRKSRNKVFLNVFIFLLCRLLSSICDILHVCCSPHADALGAGHVFLSHKHLVNGPDTSVCWQLAYVLTWHLIGFDISASICLCIV